MGLLEGIFIVEGKYHGLGMLYGVGLYASLTGSGRGAFFLQENIKK